jgi:hypothetical protein
MWELTDIAKAPNGNGFNFLFDSPSRDGKVTLEVHVSNEKMEKLAQVLHGFEGWRKDLTPEVFKKY